MSFSLKIIGGIVAAAGMALFSACGIFRGRLVHGKLMSQPWIELLVSLCITAAVFYFSLRSFRGSGVIRLAFLISSAAALFTTVGGYVRYRKTIEESGDSLSQACRVSLLKIQGIAGFGQFIFTVSLSWLAVLILEDIFIH